MGRSIKTKRLDAFRLQLPRHGAMRIPAEVFASERIPIEADALAQLADAASLEGVERVLATPDIHVGFGVPIGAVIAASDFVSPAAVGYDINCGMRLMTTSEQADDTDLAAIAAAIRRVIPLGEGKSNIRVSRRSMEHILREGVSGLLWALAHEPGIRRDHRLLADVDLQEETELLGHIERRGCLPGEPEQLSERAWERGLGQLGTLGGGNHFVELQRVDEVVAEEAAAAFGLRRGQLVVMVHSGSRGLGHEVGGTFMKLASRQGRGRVGQRAGGQLATLALDSDLGRSFIGAMNSAANFAFANRHCMAMLIRGVLSGVAGIRSVRPLYDVAHNLAVAEQHGSSRLMIHRKGATRAFPPARMVGTPFEQTGQPVLIPGSMGTASWVLRGIASGERSLFSTNHGAGRLLSRSAALGRGRRGKGGGSGAISEAEFQASMAGVLLLCERPGRIREEAPGAYKDIDAVIETVAGAGLAEPVARLMPLAVLKG